MHYSYLSYQIGDHRGCCGGIWGRCVYDLLALKEFLISIAHWMLRVRFNRSIFSFEGFSKNN